MNYYEILEVSEHASSDVIKAAYKSLMQRYHPDRNPGNAQAAMHAARVVQAYEMLSDTSQRVAYDIELKRSLANLHSFPGKSRDAPARRAVAGNDDTPHWYVWVFITLIALSIWYIFSPTKSTLPPETELQEIRASIAGNQLTLKQLQVKINRIDEIFRQHPEIKAREKIAQSKDLMTRTLPIFIRNLAVNLKDSSTEYELSIPVISVTVGTFDSEKFIRNIESNSEFISEKLADKLSAADYKKLDSKDGEQYLESLILNSIGETTGANRHENYPSSKTESPGRYGVIEVWLPELFTLKKI